MVQQTSQSALPASIHYSLNYVMKHGWFKGQRLIDLYLNEREYLVMLARHWHFDEDIPKMARDTLAWAQAYIKP